MKENTTSSNLLSSLSIWWFAFGYFACYVPYSATTKALSKGWFPGLETPLQGASILPISVMTSAVAMLAFITAMGWWKHASRRDVAGKSVPMPGKWTFLSGLGTAAVILTTTLAYTFSGISIVFAMLLMRGGVLILAPIVDGMSGRRVKWFSWIALVLSLAALVVAFAEDGGYTITTIAAIDIGIYLSSYFLRLRLMSRLAKSEDESANLRYFVEEQMVAAPSLLIALALFAFLGSGPFAAALHVGFTEFWGTALFLPLAGVGLLSQGTGIFGGLILLSKEENTFCVPVNRSSSILAGVMASVSLAFFFGAPPLSTYQLAGAALIIAAIVFLTLPTLMKRNQPLPASQRQ